MLFSDTLVLVSLKCMSTLLPKGNQRKFMWELVAVAAPGCREPPLQQKRWAGDLPCFSATAIHSPAISVHGNKLIHWVCRDMVGCEPRWFTLLALLLCSRTSSRQLRHRATSWAMSCHCEIRQGAMSQDTASTCRRGGAPVVVATCCYSSLKQLKLELQMHEKELRSTPL